MTLGEKQELFVELQARWVQWVLSHPGWRLRLGEGRILQMGPSGRGRTAVDVITLRTIPVKDAVHMSGGAHYNGVGADWNLFVYDVSPSGVLHRRFDGDKDVTWITSGGHPAWVAAGEHWESLHPLCRWGGRFGDANHISLEHEGKK